MYQAALNCFALEALESRRLLSVQTFTPLTPSTALQSETLGKDGSLYFVEADQQQIGRILPNKKIVEYTVPDSFGDIGTLVTAKDGSIWFNTTNGDRPVLGHLSTKGKVSSIEINNDASTLGAASDGAVWFSSPEDGLGRVSTRNAVSYLGGPAIASVVTRIIAAPGGGVYYDSVAKSSDGGTTPFLFSVHRASVVDGQIQDATLYSGETTFNFASGTTIESANNLALGADGNLWFYDGTFLRGENLDTHAIAQIRPSTAFGVSSLIAGPDGSLWFVDHTGGRPWVVSNGASPQVDIKPLDGLGQNPGTPYAIIPGKGNTLWITDETNGVIYNLVLSRTGPTHLSGTVDQTTLYSNGFYVPGPFQLSLGFINNWLPDTFEIQRSTSASGPYTAIGTVQGGAGFVAYVATVAPSTTYYYRVHSVSRVLSSGFAGPIKIVVPAHHADG